MALEILLRRNIEGVGAVGEIVKVKNGYARNFLLPHGYAALVSPDAMLRVKQDRKVESVRQDRLSAERAGIAARLKDLTLTVEARAGVDGHLYGSVATRQLIAAFALADFQFVDRQIRFEAVRELGEYECTVVLSEDTQVGIKVWVVQDAAEAAADAADAADAARAQPERTDDAGSEQADGEQADGEGADASDA